MKNRTEENPGEVVFDVTSIKYFCGRARMTLWTEYNRQQKMHETTAAKSDRLSEALKAKEVLTLQEESKIEALKTKAPKKAAAKKSSTKTK